MADVSTDRIVLCELRTRHVDRESAVTVHRTGVVLLTHRQGHGVAGSVFTADRAGHRNIATGLFGVDDVVTGNGVELNGQRRRRGVDAIRARGLGAASIACRIRMRDRRTDSIDACSCQYRTRYRHAERAVLCDRRCIALVAHADRHRIAGRGITTGTAGNGDLRCRFGGVDHVIAGEGVQRDRNGRQFRAGRIIGRRIGRAHVTRRVGVTNVSTDRIVLCELRTRHVDREGTVVVHRTGVVLLTDRQGHGVAGSVFTADRAGHRNIATGLIGVDDVVTGNGVELNGQRRGRGVDAIRTSGLGAASIACRIRMRDRRTDSVGACSCQYRTRYRHAERTVLAHGR
ncbi:hypothetical protein KSP9073_03477 [Kushneria phyllosphaerae]|uniref:Uncharacterized protein n=1 Tax=Kushneria phyllosphaerae TaxID=2100822 RepID=A0A2R8CR92_9GAMM|nr:hypothetical protein KSP9073_03477 [Kushneria phyllosphaerae]